MKTAVYRLCAASWILLTALLADPFARQSMAVVVINEVHVNPPGGDGNIEFIEFISTTGGVEPLAGLVLVQIDSTGPTIGTIMEAYNLGANTGASATGFNGLLLIGNNYPTPPPGGPWASMISPATAVGDPTGAAPFSGMGNSELENDGFTLLLVTGFTGAVTTDLDADDNGVLDSTPWASIQDSVGWRTGLGAGLGFADVTYSPVDLSIELYTPDSVARFRGDFRANTAAAWYGGDVAGATGTSVDYDPAEQFRVPTGATITPGNRNALVPEPSAAVLAAVGLVLSAFFISRTRIKSKGVLHASA